MTDSSRPSVYVETTVISYLTARPVRDPLVAGQMLATRSWWTDARRQFDLYSSALVVAEASAGDPQAAAERFATLSTLPLLPIGEDARQLATALLTSAALPMQAKADALHVAIATMNGLDYLVTWNCRHLSNAILRTKIERTCRQQGLEPPVICTPLELQQD